MSYKMKKHYIVYFEDGRHCYKEHIPAENEKEVKDWVEGNGNIIAIKKGVYEEENEYISIDKIAEALKMNYFGQLEIDLITRALIKTCKFIK